MTIPQRDYLKDTITGYAGIVKQHLDHGYQGYSMTFMFNPLSGGIRRMNQQMRNGIENMYASLVTRLYRRPHDHGVIPPILISCPDFPRTGTQLPRRRPMRISFRPDRKIAFRDLMNAPFEKYEITVADRHHDIHGNPSGTLVYDGTMVLVRSDRDGNVDRLIPTDQNWATGYIMIKVGAVLGAGLEAVSEPLDHFLAEEVQ
jgi:hypothetical protein